MTELCYLVSADGRSLRVAERAGRALALYDAWNAAAHEGGHVEGVIVPRPATPVPVAAARATVARLDSEASQEVDDADAAAALRACFAVPRLLHAGDVFHAASRGGDVAYVVVSLNGGDALGGIRLAAGIVSSATSRLLADASPQRRTRHPPDGTSLYPPAADAHGAFFSDSRACGAATAIGDDGRVQCTVLTDANTRRRVSALERSLARALFPRVAPPPSGDGEPLLPLILLCGAAGAGKRVVVARVARHAGYRVVEVDGALVAAGAAVNVPGGSATAGGIERAVAAALDAAAEHGGTAPIMVHLRRCEALTRQRGSRDVDGGGGGTAYPVAVAAEQVRRAIERCVRRWQQATSSLDGRAAATVADRALRDEADGSQQVDSPTAPMSFGAGGAWEELDATLLLAVNAGGSGAEVTARDDPAVRAPPPPTAFARVSSPPTLLVCSARVPRVGALPPPLARLFAASLSAPPPSARAVARLLQRHVAGAPGVAVVAAARDALLRAATGVLVGSTPGAVRAFAAFVLDAAREAGAGHAEQSGDGAIAGVGGAGGVLHPRPPAAVLTVTAAHVAAAARRWEAAQPPAAWDSPRVPEGVTFDDVGAAAEARRELADLLELPLQHAALFPAAAPHRTGVLLYGPPGCGKTLLARAVAASAGAAFLAVQGPELLDAYIGESEAGVRRVFAAARAAAPCVLFFDEVDALGGARGRGGGADSAGVADRVLSQLLLEMDALQPLHRGTAAGGVDGDDGRDDDGDDDDADYAPTSSAAGVGDWAAHVRAAPPRRVFLLAATNRPDLLDPALTRPGRLERAVYVGVPEGAEARCGVLRALTRRLRLGADVDLPAVAAALHPRATGADMSAVVAAAFADALRDGAAAGCSDARHHAVVDDVDQPLVSARHFARAIAAGLRPSVSDADLRHFDALRRRLGQL